MPEQQYLSGGHPAFRVRDKDTKHEYTVGVVDPDAHEEIDGPAVDASGAPLPPKHHLTASQKKALEAESGDNSKGASK